MHVVAKAVAGAFIIISALRRARMTGPLCRGFAFRVHYGIPTLYSNLAGGHVIYAITACKKYSSSLSRTSHLTLTESI